MKKLLLLTTLPLVAFLSSFAGNQQAASLSNFNDSTKQENINPRAGFRNLFEEGNTAEFAVKLNPKAVSFVEDYKDTYTQKLTNMKTWGKRYFDIYDEVLSRYGLPTELKYLSVIESELKANAKSWVGARGPWQFMPQTARELGLRVSGKVDERTDFKKSTVAAARYLNQLYNIFGDWLLVIAAYNTGPGNVLSAIKKSGTRNFWELQNYLPAESRNHVKKFIATHYIMEGDGGVTTLTKAERAQHLEENGIEAGEGNELQQISGKYNSTAITQVLNMSAADFNRLNPGFDKEMANSGNYNLRLPAEKMQQFQTSRNQILEASVRAMLAMN
jgi:membrane-bound lytic murein transglycosylase D